MNILPWNPANTVEGILWVRVAGSCNKKKYIIKTLRGLFVSNVKMAELIGPKYIYIYGASHDSRNGLWTVRIMKRCLEKMRKK